MNFVWPIWEGDIVRSKTWPDGITTHFMEENDFGIHDGIDIDTDGHPPIYASYNGIVSSVKREMKGYGYHVVIQHENSYKSLYAHLSEIHVVKDQEVTPETVVGLAGSTGLSTGEHLHFEIQYKTVPVDPEEHLQITHDEYMLRLEDLEKEFGDLSSRLNRLERLDFEMYQRRSDGSMWVQESRVKNPVSGTLALSILNRLEPDRFIDDIEHPEAWGKLLESKPDLIQVK